MTSFVGSVGSAIQRRELRGLPQWPFVPYGCGWLVVALSMGVLDGDKGPPFCRWHLLRALAW